MLTFEIENFGSFRVANEAFFLLSPDKVFPVAASIKKEKPSGPTQEISFASPMIHAAVLRRVSVSASDMVVLPA